MLNITRSGIRPEDAARAITDVPARILPYAAATALTRTVKRAQAAVIASMESDFDRPTRYTLNSTFIKIASKDDLTARIGVKNEAAGGTTPENFLAPEVFGGGRREKRFEVAMRRAGFMRAGERAMPGAGVAKDAYGNVSASTISGVLRQTGSGKGGRIFAGTVGRRGTRGIWQRNGRSLKPLFIFTTAQPHYAMRLDFQASAEQAVKLHYTDEFFAAVRALQAKGMA